MCFKERSPPWLRYWCVACSAPRHNWFFYCMEKSSKFLYFYSTKWWYSPSCSRQWGEKCYKSAAAMGFHTGDPFRKQFTSERVTFILYQFFCYSIIIIQSILHMPWQLDWIIWIKIIAGRIFIDKQLVRSVPDKYFSHWLELGLVTRITSLQILTVWIKTPDQQAFVQYYCQPTRRWRNCISLGVY